MTKRQRSFLLNVRKLSSDVPRTKKEELIYLPNTVSILWPGFAHFRHSHARAFIKIAKKREKKRKSHVQVMRFHAMKLYFCMLYFKLSSSQGIRQCRIYDGFLLFYLAKVDGTTSHSEIFAFWHRRRRRISNFSATREGQNLLK